MATNRELHTSDRNPKKPTKYSLDEFFLKRNKKNRYRKAV